MCFRKILGPKKFFDKRGGEFQDFASKYFCLIATKNAGGEHFSLSIRFGHRKSLDERVGGGAECQKFVSKISCLIVPEIFVRQTFRVSLNYGLEKFFASEG